jgi:hypothetical protein
MVSTMAWGCQSAFDLGGFEGTLVDDLKVYGEDGFFTRERTSPQDIMTSESSEDETCDLDRLEYNIPIPDPDYNIPILDPDDDPYDPRSPEYIIPASPEEVILEQAALLKQQAACLQASLNRRSRENSESLRVVEHYSQVLADMAADLHAGQLRKPAVVKALPSEPSTSPNLGWSLPMAASDYASETENSLVSVASAGLDQINHRLHRPEEERADEQIVLTNSVNASCRWSAHESSRKNSRSCSPCSPTSLGTHRLDGNPALPRPTSAFCSPFPLTGASAQSCRALFAFDLSARTAQMPRGILSGNRRSVAL